MEIASGVAQHKNAIVIRVSAAAMGGVDRKGDIGQPGVALPAGPPLAIARDKSKAPKLNTWQCMMKVSLRVQRVP